MTCPSFRGRTLTCDQARCTQRGTALISEARGRPQHLAPCRVRLPAVALGSGRHKTRRIRTLRGMGGVLLARCAASDFGSDAWTQG